MFNSYEISRGVVSKINDNYFSKVIFGNNNVYKVKRKSTFPIPTLHGKKKLINDNFLTPALKKNVLSVRQMMEKSYKFVFDNK